MYFARSPHVVAHPHHDFRDRYPRFSSVLWTINLGRRTFPRLFSLPQFRSRFIVDRAAHLR